MPKLEHITKIFLQIVLFSIEIFNFESIGKYEI